MNDKIITVTSPLLPNLKEFESLLSDIWDSRWITNNGSYHKELEDALCDYLNVPFISLFTNGTLPLITALQALRITGEVITTPFSFVATTHALWWNGIKPVFVDIDSKTGNLDPKTSKEIMEVLDKINKELGTTIIMATHDKDIVNKMKKRVIVIDKGLVAKDTLKGKYKDEGI